MRASMSGVNGFRRNDVPDSETPWRTIASSTWGMTTSVRRRWIGPEYLVTSRSAPGRPPPPGDCNAKLPAGDSAEPKQHGEGTRAAA